MPDDRAALVARVIARHPRFAEPGRCRYGLTSGAAKMTKMALKAWAEAWEPERAGRVVGDLWR